MVRGPKLACLIQTPALSLADMDSLGKPLNLSKPQFPYLLSSVPQSCPTLCVPVNRSTPGLLSIINSRSLPTPMSIESVMPSSHLNLCRPLLLLPSIFPSIRVISSHQVAKVLEFQLYHQSFQ